MLILKTVKELHLRFEAVLIRIHGHVQLSWDEGLSSTQCRVDITIVKDMSISTLYEFIWGNTLIQPATCMHPSNDDHLFS